MAGNAVLVDTCVLVEATDAARSGHSAAKELLETHRSLRFPAQVAREYLVVATRPPTRNGLGLEVSDALENLRQFRRRIRLLAEERPLLPTLLRLLQEVPVAGRAVHDAHIVAAAMAHSIATIVTLNAKDFRRFPPRVVLATPSEALRAR